MLRAGHPQEEDRQRSPLMVNLDIKRLGEVELTAIDIGHDVTRYYGRAVKPRDLSQVRNLAANGRESHAQPHQSSHRTFGAGSGDLLHRRP
jgi:hypothetical protein